MGSITSRLFISLDGVIDDQMEEAVGGLIADTDATLLGRYRSAAPRVLPADHADTAPNTGT